MVSKYEQLAKKELREQGWLVDWKVRPQRPMRGYTVDYFNLFDILAHRAGDPLRMISIKGHAGVPSKHRKAIKDFAVSLGMQKEIWTYKSNKEVKKEIIE